MKLMHIWVLNCISFAIFVQVIAHSSAACVWQYTSVLSGSKNKPHWWCRALKYDTLFSLSLQPLDMNSVELAQHNLSARPPPSQTWATFFSNHCSCSSCWGPKEEEEEEAESGREAQTVTSTHHVQLRCWSTGANVAVTPQTCLCNIWFVCFWEEYVNGAHSRTSCSHFFVCLFAQFSPLSLVQRIFDAMILIALLFHRFFKSSLLSLSLLFLSFLWL